MKYIRSFVLLAVCALLFSFCKKEPAEKKIIILSGDNQGSMGLDECIEFQSPSFWTVCLTDISEYRCPCDVQCLWAGSVDYTLHVTGPNLDSTFVLHPPGNALNTPGFIEMNGIRMDIAEMGSTECSDYANYDLYKLEISLSY
jgi:hypothetical protein